MIEGSQDDGQEPRETADGAAPGDEVEMGQPENSEDSERVQDSSLSGWSRFWRQARQPRQKRVGLAILVFIVMVSLVVGFVLGGLKACWFG